MTLVHHLQLKLEFPSGLSPGEGSRGNLLTISTDGQGRPVLRGTALAGVLRAAYSKRHSEFKNGPKVSNWFGSSLSDQEADHASRLQVSDMVLEAGKGGKLIRTFNALNRHTGAVLDGGLFSIEALPPGTSGQVVLTLEDPQSTGENLLRELVGELESGLQLGGRVARGIGKVTVTSAEHRTYDISKLEDHAAFLNACWSGNIKGKKLVGTISEKRLVVQVVLTVPRGQDLCVGDGEGIDHTVEPQCVVDVNGNRTWRLPGSSLRGVMRGWVTRLAAQDGCKVADNIEQELKQRESIPRPSKISSDDIAWGFIPSGSERQSFQQDPSQIKCPVMNLFGSSYTKSRIHISDAISKDGIGQSRQHVSIDRISGGANEGFLFSHQALTGKPVFQFQLSIEEPTEQEAKWVSSTLRALDMGLLRIGSSKSSGRLAIAKSPSATGQHENLFNQLQPMGNQ